MHGGRIEYNVHAGGIGDSENIRDGADLVLEQQIFNTVICKIPDCASRFP